MNLHIDIVELKTLHAYYGDNDNGKTGLRQATFDLKYFKLSNRLLGTKKRDGSEGSVDGFWRDHQVVLSHRGLRNGGQAVYLMKAFFLGEGEPFVFSGYVIAEDWKHRAPDLDWFIKCPVLMVEDNPSKLMETADIRKEYPYVNTKCIQFSMPKSLSDTTVDGKTIDDILADKSATNVGQLNQILAEKD